MSEGRFLRTITTLREIDLLSQKLFDVFIRDAIARLRNNTLPATEAGAAWGLGFAYKSAPADEPYIITTAQIVISLLEASRYARDPEPLLSLASCGLKWLIEGVPRKKIKHRDAILQVPVFSPHVNQIVYNAIATWSAALAMGQQSNLSTNLDVNPHDIGLWVMDQWIPDIGWMYSEDTSVVDLLHQNYIIDALGLLYGTESQSTNIFTMINQFRFGEKFFDTSTIARAQKLCIVSTDFSHGGIWLKGNWVQRYSIKSARPWSIGAVLRSAAVALLIDVGMGSFWEAAVRHIALEAIHMTDKQLSGIAYLRELTHLSDGMAMALRALRTSSRCREDDGTRLNEARRTECR